MYRKLARQDILGPRGCSVLQSSSSAGRGVWSQGHRWPSDLLGRCWIIFCKPFCTVAELLPPSLAGLSPDSHRSPLLRLFTGTHAHLNLCACPASSCGVEDVVPITAKASLSIRAIYIYSFCYLCALLCPGEFCSSLPAFKHKYPQWGLQIHTSLENWHVILRAAMQHPNYTSHKAWKRKWASNVK